MTKKPLILICANITDYNGSPGHIVRDTYISALLNTFDCVPLMLPSVLRRIDFKDVADRIDGVLLTGSVTNVAPACYGADQQFGDELLDLARDSTTLPMITQSIERDIPLLAICRGFQELNVAMGGTLHQKVEEVPGMQDHRLAPEIAARGVLDAYRHPAHKVIPREGGLLDMWGLTDEFMVNTIHQQGVDKLGDGLFVEAVAEDGLVEAVSVPGKRFIFGTQWHPEGDVDVNASSRKIFEKFGDAVRG